jgi:hypothetical protein
MSEDSLCWCGEPSISDLTMMCLNHTRRFIKNSSVCAICWNDFIVDEKRYGVQLFRRGADSETCTHWFCRSCIVKYEPDYCIRCSLEIESLNSIVCCGWGTCVREPSNEYRYCNYHFEIYTRYRDVCCLCHASSKEERYIDSIVNYGYNEDECIHWFCMKCIHLYALKECPTCFKDISLLINDDNEGIYQDNIITSTIQYSK